MKCEHYDICGRQAHRDNQGKCLLHLPASAKSPDRFAAAMAEHLRSGHTDFRHMVFPEEFTFPDDLSGAKIDFRHATFGGTPQFGDEFRVPVLFEDATFEGAADFRNTHFHENAPFDHAHIEGFAIFKGATFKGEFSFVGGVVEGLSDFSEMEVNGDLHLGSEFNSKVQLHLAHIRGNAIIDGSKFHGGVECDDLRCEKEFSTSGANFGDSTYFGGAQFEGVADFQACDFLGHASFGNVSFQEVANFSMTEFTEETTFDDCTFYDTVTFSGANFHDSLEFSHNQCATKLLFSGVDIAGETYFSKSCLAEGIGPCDQVSFSRATFGDDVTLEGAHRGAKTFAGTEVTFNEAELRPEVEVYCHHVDLSRCELRSMDMSRFHFLGVRWCEQVADGECFSRVGLYDEVKIKHEETDYAPWSEVEGMYRQLKQSYQNRGDFPRAGDFHIGEKEMRRKNPETRTGMWALLTVYRAVSKYGERAFPALLWLLSLVLISSFGYLLTGVEPGAGEGPLTPNRLSDWWAAFLLSVEISVLFGSTASFSNLAAETIRILQAIISPPLLALLALALRQQVKR